MRRWMMPEMDDLEGIFEELFSRDVEMPHHAHHPPKEVLRCYLSGRLSRSWRGPERLLSDPQGEWRHQEVSAHLISCRRCREEFHTLKASKFKLWRQHIWSAGRALRGRLAQVPRPALATIAVQSLIIAALTALLFVQPAPLFPQPEEVPPAAAVAGASEEAAPAEVGEAALPEPLAQAIQTLTEDPNPQVRLSAAKRLRQWSDPRLVELLTQVYERERHPEVRDVLAQTLSSIWTHTEGQYINVARSLRRLLEREHQGPLSLRMDIDLGRILSELDELRLELKFPRTLICTGRPDLTLEELSMLASQLDGRILIDHSLGRGSFRIRLMGQEHMPSALISKLKLSCQE